MNNTMSEEEEVEGRVEDEEAEKSLEDDEAEVDHHYNDYGQSRHTLDNHRFNLNTRETKLSHPLETTSPYNSESLITNNGNMRRSTNKSSYY